MLVSMQMVTLVDMAVSMFPMMDVLMASMALVMMVMLLLPVMTVQVIHVAFVDVLVDDFFLAIPSSMITTTTVSTFQRWDINRK